MKSMKFVRYIGYGILAISVIIVAVFFISSDFNAEDYPMADLILNWTYTMLILAGATAVLLPLIALAKDPKKLVKSLAGIGVVTVVILICYLASSDAPVTLADGEVISNAAVLKVSDTGLIATYIAFFGTIIAIAAGEVWSIIKKR